MDGHFVFLSDHQERIAQLAKRVFGDEDAASLWLREVHPLLQGRAPLVVAHDEAGAARIEQLLHNIEFGLPV